MARGSFNAKRKGPTPVDAIKHRGARVNIPTEELRHGVDVYDPTTGQIRSSSTGDIACWFIDTNHYGDEVLKVYEVAVAPSLG